MQNYLHNGNGKNTDLPVISKLAECYKLWQEFYQNLPKNAKYTIGERADNLFIDMIEQLINARHQSSIKKVEPLERAAMKLELLKFLFQVMWEKKYIDNKKYIAISDPLNEIGKMLGGWLKYVKDLPNKK